MIRHPRRVLPATIVAVLLLAACVLVALSCIQLLAGARPLLPFAALASFGQRLHWHDPWVLVAGGVAAALGIVLLLCAALPGRPTVLPLTEKEPMVLSGLSRRGLARAFSDAAAATAGVTDARVRPRGRRRLVVRVGTRLDERDGVRDQVAQALGSYTDRLALAARPTVRVRVQTREKA